MIVGGKLLRTCKIVYFNNNSLDILVKYAEKRGKENKDPDFVPGKSRRSGYYNPNRDDRNVSIRIRVTSPKYQ